MQLMLLLLSGFSWLKPHLGHLEPAYRHMYLFDDQGIRHLKYGAWWVGHWGLWHSGRMHNNQHGHYALDIILDLLSHGYNGIPGSSQHIVHLLFLVLHCLPSTLTC